MTTNPMKRKARNSFLLGILVTLIIATLIIGYLIMQMAQMKKKEKAAEQSYKQVYVLAADVKSGEPITMDKLVVKNVIKDAIPEGAFYLNSQLQTEEVTETTNTPETNNVNNTNTENTTNSIQKTSNDAEVIQKISNDLNKKIYLYSKSSISKIDLKSGTVITIDMLNLTGEEVTNDLRKQEYNMIVLPTQIKDGDVIDIRLRLPSGQDYIVVSKKRVELPKISGTDSEDTIWLKMAEEEILMMSNAIVENYFIKGSELYATTYIQPGTQQNSTITYSPSHEVRTLIENDSNIVQKAKDALVARYSTRGYVDQRNEGINPQIQKNSEDGKSSVETKIESQITKSKETRKKYLDSLTSTEPVTTTTSTTKK